MMDEAARPGDHLPKKRSPAWIALFVVLFIIFLPLIAVFWFPALAVLGFLNSCHMINPCLRIFCSICMFIIALPFGPLANAAALVWFVFWCPYRLIKCCIDCYKADSRRREAERLESINRERAIQNVKEFEARVMN